MNTNINITILIKSKMKRYLVYLVTNDLNLHLVSFRGENLSILYSEVALNLLFFEARRNLVALSYCLRSNGREGSTV